MNKIILLMVGLLVLGFLVGIITAEPEINLTCPKLEPIIIKEDCEVSLFKQMANNLDNEKEYKANKYDCTEYSKELSRRYEDEGWDSEVIRTVVDCDNGLLDKDLCNQFEGRHDMVKIDTIYVEATSGRIVSPKDYKGYGLR